MNDRIDKIQKEIDELIRLLAGAGMDASEFGEELDVRSKIGYLALKLQDDQLDADQVGKLEQWLSSDDQILQYYLDFQNLNALLYTYYNTERVQNIFQKIRESLIVTHQ